MAKTTKLTVTTDVGTFTRTTARTYTHLVVVGPERPEVIERDKAQRIADLHEHIAYCRRQLTSAEKIYSWETAETVEAQIAQAEQRLTEVDAEFAAKATEPFGPCGWCGRFDLAVKEANGYVASRRQDVRIYEVATGRRVK